MLPAAQPLVQVQVPPGATPGTILAVLWNGTTFQVVVPQGVASGTILQVPLPSGNFLPATITSPSPGVVPALETQNNNFVTSQSQVLQQPHQEGTQPSQIPPPAQVVYVAHAGEASENNEEHTQNSNMCSCFGEEQPLINCGRISATISLIIAVICFAAGATTAGIVFILFFGVFLKPACGLYGKGKC